MNLFDSNYERTLRQEELVEEWVKHRCVGTIQAAVGFGKTRTAIIAIRRFQKKNPLHKIIIAVPSDAIRVQWEKELEQNGLNAEVKTYFDTSKHEYECTLLILDK